MAANPFTPGFGTSPRILVGREEVLGEIGAAFGSVLYPHRTTWLRAPRGSGKTVLLNEIQDLAAHAGWLVVQEDAQSPGSLAERVARRLLTQADERAQPRRRVQAAGITTPVVGASIEFAARERGSPLLRAAIARVLDRRGAAAAGVLVTVDEIHTAPRSEVAHLGNAIQHLIREDRPVAIVVAGLPVADVDDLATFLRRCTKPRIDELSASAVRVGLQRTAALEGGGFSSAALDLAVAATAGYPYMLQLVGYWSWRSSRDGDIDEAAVRDALPRCERELLEGVVGLRELAVSPAAQRYLEAMAVDEAASSTSEVAARLGLSITHAGVYRRRLIDAGAIQAAGHGFVTFSIPGHRALLRLRRLHEVAVA